MRLRVTPFYGWGWFKKDGTGFEVPAPFELDAEVIEAGKPFRAAIGQTSTDHIFAGKWVLLAQRHKPEDGQCSLFVFDRRPAVIKVSESLPETPEVTGFAEARVSE